MTEETFQRYAKQMLFTPIGRQGQERLSRSRVLVCGCGALGSVIAETLARAGVGRLRIVDRDFVELSNLQRQVLFDEQDEQLRLPKSIAAAEKLRRINSEISIEAVVADINHTNVLGFFDDIDLVMDGSDNFEVRFLINEAALHTGVPWIYGGRIGSHGQTMTIFPGQSACLRCLIETIPEPGAIETCDTAGILGPAVNVVAALQSTDALKILSGNKESVAPVLTVVDVWDASLRRLNVADLRAQQNCPTCVQGERDWLSGRHGARTVVLCGRNSVQISPTGDVRLDLDELAARWQSAGEVIRNPYLLRLVLTGPDFDITAFRDGRAIIMGTQDVGVAKSLYARYIGA